jgi:hypothetical protein
MLRRMQSVLTTLCVCKCVCVCARLRTYTYAYVCVNGCRTRINLIVFTSLLIPSLHPSDVRWTLSSNSDSASASAARDTWFLRIVSRDPPPHFRASSRAKLDAGGIGKLGWPCVMRLVRVGQSDLPKPQSSVFTTDRSIL